MKLDWGVVLISLVTFRSIYLCTIEEVQFLAGLYHRYHRCVGLMTQKNSKKLIKMHRKGGEGERHFSNFKFVLLNIKFFNCSPSKSYISMHYWVRRMNRTLLQLSFTRISQFLEKLILNSFNRWYGFSDSVTIGEKIYYSKTKKVLQLIFCENWEK